MLGGIEFDGRKSDLTSVTEALGMVSAGRITENDYRALEDTALYISSLPDERLIRVMRLRYLENLDWPEIALRMGYCASLTYALHSRALRLLPPPPEDPP